MDDAAARALFEALAREDPGWSGRAAADPDRPRYHFLPPPGWMNDPIPFFADGRYHVFFQHNPGRPYWGDMHWGHAASADLLSWRHVGVALAPGPMGPDAGGVWTGCVVDGGAGRGERYSALYTGVDPQVQCLAASADLRVWRKEGVVLGAAARPAGAGQTFRDPCVWHDGAAWRMVLGADGPGGPAAGGRPLLFRSPDLRDWAYQGVLCEGPGVWDECPDLFPLGDCHVLLSSRERTGWATGVWDGARLRVERHGWLDHGCGYAAKTLRDGGGRRLAFAWLREERPTEAQVRAGWSGALSLPWVLSILPDGGLGVAPAPELAGLRDGRVAPDAPSAGGCFEVRARVAPGRAGALVLQGDLRLEWDPARGSFCGAPLALGEGEPLEVAAFVDRSVVEVFANGRLCVTRRRYGPARDGVEAAGGLRVTDLAVWRLRVPGAAGGG